MLEQHRSNDNKSMNVIQIKQSKLFDHLQLFISDSIQKFFAIAVLLITFLHRKRGAFFHNSLCFDCKNFGMPKKNSVSYQPALQFIVHFLLYKRKFVCRAEATVGGHKNFHHESSE